MSLKDFQFQGKLGEGAFSSVYKVKRLIDNEIYAIKKVKMNNLTEREKQNSLNEVRILASIDNPHVIAYKEAFIDKATNYLYIVMEFADDGDLYAKINKYAKANMKFTETEIWSIFIQAARGLKALHELRILHRDLKSANVFLFSNGSVKLGDMNVSKLAKSMCKTQTGTPYYASPQVWKDLPYDKKSDIWSLGCILYEAIALKPPFRGNDMEDLFKKVTRGFYPRIPPEYSDEVNNILKMLLQVTPHLRPTCDKLLELPIVSKHLECLPQDLQTVAKEEKAKVGNKLSEKQQQLLKTIRINHDSKDNMDLNMPRPRYVSTIEEVSPFLEPVLEEILGNFGAKKKSSKNNDSADKLPPIQHRRNSKSIQDQQEPHVVKWNAQNDFVKKIVNKDDGAKELGSKSLHVRKNRSVAHSYATLDYQPHGIIREEKMNRLKKVDELRKSEKLPLIHQGRLKSMSPELIKKLIKREKEKRKVYSIIEKRF